MSDYEFYHRCREFIEQQSEGEWPDEMIDADAEKLVTFVHDMIARSEASA